jgi:hypothetical protein
LAIILVAVFCCLYVVVVLTCSTEELTGDEGDYLSLACNITRGYISTDQSVNLWHPPGYALFLAPFVAVGLPRIAMRLANGLLLAVAAFFLYRTLLFTRRPRTALAFTCLFALYVPFYKSLIFIHSEIFSVALICAFSYYLTKYVRTDIRRNSSMLGASATLALLAMTRVLFGYVIVIMLFIAGLGSFIAAVRFNRRVILVWTLGLLFCVPYLSYTFALTGKPFYWSSAGGLSLYWMSSPYPEEYGDWFAPDEVMTRPELTRHRAFFTRLSQLDQIEADDALKEKAVEQIREYPLKFLVNSIANAGRLFFSYPYSYTQQKLSTFYYLLPNILLIHGILAAATSHIRRRRLWYTDMKVFVVMGLAYMLLTLPLSAYARMLFPCLPWITLWIGSSGEVPEVASTGV